MKNMKNYRLNFKKFSLVDVSELKRRDIAGLVLVTSILSFIIWLSELISFKCVEGFEKYRLLTFAIFSIQLLSSFSGAALILSWDTRKNIGPVINYVVGFMVSFIIVCWPS